MHPLNFARRLVMGPARLVAELGDVLRFVRLSGRVGGLQGLDHGERSLSIAGPDAAEPSAEGQPRRSIRIDRLKFWCAIAVVLLHGKWLLDLSPYANYLTVNGLFRAAVPAFALISGYYFSRQESSARRRWLLRIAQLYGLWSVVYLYFWFPASASRHDLVETARNMLFGYHHLWYLPGIFLSGVIFIALAPSRWLGHIALACGVVGVALQYYVILGGYLPELAFRNGPFFLLPFFYIGHLLRTRRVPTIAGWLVGLGMALVLLESSAIYFSGYRGDVDIMISLYVLVPAIAAHQLSPTTHGDVRQSGVYRLSDWIYFFHPLTISLFEQFVPFLVSSLLACVTTVAVGMLTRDLRARASRSGLPL